jgi:hypothetical protein
MHALAAHPIRTQRHAASNMARSQAAARGMCQAAPGPVPVSLHPRAVLQTKLAVSSPSDVYEQEADRVADQVMRMADSPAFTPCACGGSCPRCQAKSGQLGAGSVIRPGGAREPAPDPAPDLSSVVARGTSGGGQALDGDTRAFMEQRFGHDFGNVRVHTDGGAAESAGALGALAYTVGDHIVFGAGHYAPQTTHGRRLLAHELTHTVQQTAVAQNVGRSIAPEIHTGVGGVVQRVDECVGRSQKKCRIIDKIPCSTEAGSSGFCGWGFLLTKSQCLCFPNDKRISPEVQQKVLPFVIAALIAIGFILTVRAIAAIIVCLAGPCEFLVLSAAIGVAAALAVIAVLKTHGVSRASSTGPTAEAGGGDAAGESAPA